MLYSCRRYAADAPKSKKGGGFVQPSRPPARRLVSTRSPNEKSIPIDPKTVDKRASKMFVVITS
jgi:hypothetical protein